MAASSPSISAKIYLYNFEEARYDVLSTEQLTNVDGHYQVEVQLGASAYIDPKSRDVRAQIAFRATGPTLGFPWTARVDQVAWELKRQVP